MSDRLREALEVQQWVCDAFDDYMLADEGPNAVDDARFELLNRFLNGGESAMHTLVAAARRFLALTETGQQVEWCEVHRHEGFDSEHEPGWVCESGVWLEDEARWDCRMIPVYLIPADYLTEEDR